MAGSIDTVACSWVKGTIPPPTLETETWTVPGLSGHGVLWLGLRGEPVQIRAIRVGSALTVAAWAASLYALQGRQVTVVDETGTSYPSVLLKKVGRLAKQPAYNAAAGTTVRGEITIDCMRVG